MTQSPTIEQIDASQLRELIKTHREDEYLIVDVREPEEYRQGHLPGARHIPLMLFLEGVEKPPPAPLTVFYCRGGGRSQRAAEHAVKNLALENVHNLQGGIMGWNGDTLPDVPNVRVFEGAGTLPEVLRQAMDLEKGAHRLYETLHESFAGTDLQPLAQRLLEAEVGHGRHLYGLLEKVTEGPLEPFDVLFAGLPGEVLESGEALAKVTDIARRNDREGNASLLEMALDMELKALDLYRNMAHDADDPALTEAFLALAGQERAHVEALLEGISELVRR